MSEWQDISSAPKDGTEVLAWIPASYFGTGGMELAIFVRGRWWDHPDRRPQSSTYLTGYEVSLIIAA